jgi:hypothetical protein
MPTDSLIHLLTVSSEGSYWADTAAVAPNWWCWLFSSHCANNRMLAVSVLVTDRMAGISQYKSHVSGVGGGWHFQFLSSARVLMIQFHPISSFQVMIMRIHAVKPTINFQFWLFIPHYTTHFSWKWGWFMARLSSAWGSPLAFPPPFSCQILGAPGEHAPST